MELYEMKQSLSKNQDKLKSMGISLDLDSKRKQIEEKNYDAELFARGFCKEEILHYGFAFEGKKVLIGMRE